MDESRGVAQQQVPFSNGASHEAESIVPEIPKAPVDEARRLAARPGGEVPPFDQGRGEASTRGVSGHARADDPAAHHENVERFLPQPLQIRGARSSRELRHGDPVTRVPGFMIPSGSSSRFKARRTTIPSSPMTRDKYGAWSSPIP